MATKICRYIFYLPSNLIEDVCFKTVIPILYTQLGVWGDCSSAKFREMEGIFKKVPSNLHECETLAVLRSGKTENIHI